MSGYNFPQPVAVLRQNNLRRWFPRKTDLLAGPVRRRAMLSARAGRLPGRVLRCKIAPGRVRLDPDTWTVFAEPL